MTQKQHFHAVIVSGEAGGAYVGIPFDVEKEFGKKRVKVKATIDGEPYRGLLVSMGGPHHELFVRKEIRQKIGKNIGDEVEVEVEEDLEVRTVEVPPDLQQALQASPQASAFFNQLSFTHQKEYVQWITEAKRSETRFERVRRTIELLNQGKSEH